MRDFPILTFKPQFKSVIWGGKRIAEFKNMPPKGERLARAGNSREYPAMNQSWQTGRMKA